MPVLLFTCKNMLDPYILNPELVQDVTANTSANSHHEIASRALFGRIMYNYMSRYLIELDVPVMTVVPSSRKIPASSSYPTVSLGWRVSEEKFMEWSKDWLDNFKIRASWGRLGSQPDSEYPYQSVFSTSEGYFLFDGTRYPTGINTPSLINPNLNLGKIDYQEPWLRLYFLAEPIDIHRRHIREKSDRHPDTGWKGLPGIDR